MNSITGRLDRLIYTQPRLVEDAGGCGVVGKAQTTIKFAEDGLVPGDTSVNRYQARVTIDGNRITFGPMARTRRAGSRMNKAPGADESV